MERKRISLDNPAFQGRLRYSNPSRPLVQPSPLQRPLSRPEVVAPKAAIPASVPVVPVTPKPVARPATAETALFDRPVVLIKPVPATHGVRPKQQKSKVLWRKAVRRPQYVPAIESVVSTQAQALAEAELLTHMRRRPAVFYALAAMIFIIGIAVSINGFQANQQVAAQAKRLTTTSQSSGSDKEPAPSTVRPTDASVASYVVSPNLPRYISIPKLAVHARVLSMGVTSTNHLQAPGNVYDAGWYNASAQPGQPGAMLVDGHISSWTTQGVFYGLNKLVAGDAVTITRGDGQAFVYKVVKTQLYDADAVDMASLLVSQDTSKPGLNLISCSGDVIPGTNEFNKRFVVYAVEE